MIGILERCVDDFSVFTKHESAVRSYCRSFPAILGKALDSTVFDVAGKDYVDFFAGAGAVNYGHNNRRIVDSVMRYMQDGGIMHSLDFHTQAKQAFIQKFVDVILEPRRLKYRMQFTGPTGTNAVEAALKLARKVTGRTQVVAFTNGFHGVSLGALAATANPSKRNAAGLPLHDVVRMPYDGFLGTAINTADIVDGMYRTAGAGLEKPAAFILEVVQGEGGLNVASRGWLTRISQLARDLGALVIVDEVQTGCGRTGKFFGFEDLGIEPDIVCLSKSLGGIGLPIAVNLIKEKFDQWQPGEHNGTFRGNNLAFVAGSAALDYWDVDSPLPMELPLKAAWISEELHATAALFPEETVTIRGKGLLRGLVFKSAQLADKVSQCGFSEGVIAETCGPNNEVLKIMPALTIDQATLKEGFRRLRAGITKNHVCQFADQLSQ
jgi:diaminobutyrate-2-oxoglutarate transaminase